jgi:hypothetical protein
MLIPILVGAGALALLMAGGAKKAQAAEPPKKLTPEGDVEVPEPVKKAAKRAVKTALKSKDWQKAVAGALASGDRVAVAAVAIDLKKHGKTTEAKSLVRAFQEVRKRAIKPKPKALPSAKAVSPDLAFATKARNALKSATRYKEDRALVEKYQRMAGLKPDGLLGPGTARSFFDVYGLVPPPPLYWSRTNAPRQVSDWRKFASTLISKFPASKSYIQTYLIERAGR